MGLFFLISRAKFYLRALCWNDQRTAAQCESITGKIGFERLLELTGNAVLPGFTAPKILWVRENERHIYQNISHILLPKDYIRFRLTGEYATDVSDAAGTSLLDVRNRCWSDEMLKKLELPFECMATVFESQEVTGTITKNASVETGLPEGLPVVGGGGDQAAGDALLASVRTKQFLSVVEACDATVKIISKIQPNHSNVQIYKDIYPIYRQSYPALKPLYESLARTGV